MFSKIYRGLKLLNIFLDICWLNLALMSAFYLGISGVDEYFGQHKVLLFFIVINMLWLFSASVFHLYEQYGTKDSVIFYHQLIKAFLLFLVGVLFLALTLLFRDDIFDRMSLGPLFYIILFGFFFCALAATRLLFLGIRKKYRNKTDDQKKKVLVVGGNCFSRELRQRLLEDEYLPFEITGVFYNRPPDANDGLNGMYKGAFEEVFDYLTNQKIDEVFCLTKGLQQPDVYRLMEATDNHVIRLRMLMDVYDYWPSSSGQFEVINNIPLFQVRKEPLLDPGNTFLKRAFDIVFSGLVITLLLSWLLPLLAVLVKLESRGPVFFKQKRSGKDNLPFTCYKLRSMYVNRDANKVQATKNDRRITKIGAFLRKTSLDELPQFFNVFMGSMSIVGPRPHMLAHTEEYSVLVSRYMARHFLRPGITGWAQVNGSRGETKNVEQMERRVRLDIWYVENWSFMLDMKIIFLTFWQIVKGDDNAY
ncbi:MAG TPA: undecaprenyl-phosphate glucose phosphotransferase [Edaphocola sp.]|nr:undecaprenyl-phosphate glucose phosphotransferase [Edaphocola sp.]